MKIAGVIVTFNRKDLLMNNLIMQTRQKRKVDKLYIIDNHSTDGTKEFVEQQDFYDDTWIKYIYLDENTGGAGGFYYGTKAAYEDGYDYICLMDDDGRPLDENTIYELEKVANDLYEKRNKKLLLNALVTEEGKRLTFGFSMKENIDEQWVQINNLKKTQDFLEGQVNPFNGTLVSKEAIKEVGFPNKDFFVMRDEVDYVRRCEDKGILIGTVLNSSYHHPRKDGDRVIGYLRNKVRIPLFNDMNKQYYWTRNTTYAYKNNHKIRLNIILFFQFFSILFHQDQKKERINNRRKAIHDAKNGIMGKKSS